MPSGWLLIQTLRVVRSPDLPTIQKMPALVSGAGGILFGVSASAHLVCPHSERTNAVCFACDKSMIAVFLYSCSVASTMLYFREKSFASYSLLRKLSTLFNTVSCVGASYAIGMSSLGWKMDNNTKVKILVSQIVGGLYPVMFEMVQTSDKRVSGLILKYATLAVGWAAIGAAFFITFFPEKYFLGKFDKLMYSHGAMHVCVALSVISAFRGYTKVYRRTKF